MVIPISLVLLNFGLLRQINPETEYLLKNFVHLIRVIIHTVFFAIAFHRKYVSNDVWFIICPYVTFILYTILESLINYYEIRKDKSKSGEDFRDFSNFRARMASFNEKYYLKHISLVYNTYGPLILTILCAPSSLWLKSFLVMALFTQSISDARVAFIIEGIGM